MQIEVNNFQSVLTVTFLNKSFENPTPTTWVCANRDAYDRAVNKLANMPHIEIIEQGAVHVVN